MIIRAPLAILHLLLGYGLPASSLSCNIVDNSEKEKRMRLSEGVLAATLACILASCAPSMPVRAGGPVSEPAKRVEMISDAVIPRTAGVLKADIVYPSSGGPYPVIIFSHGSGGTPYAYRELTTHWAAAGFVVIAPTHADSRRLLSEQGLEGRELMLALLRSATDPQAWQRRVGDITTIIDALPTLGSVDRRLAGLADPKRVGVGGHSYGAFTSMLVACAQPRAPSGAPVNLRDPRPIAFLLLSAQGAGQQGLEPTSWSTCDRPMMVVTGTEDRGRPLGNRAPQRLAGEAGALSPVAARRKGGLGARGRCSLIVPGVGPAGGGAARPGGGARRGRARLAGASVRVSGGADKPVVERTTEIG
jgi:poly(3-hydroxybutyrate) depolymerase